VSGIEEATLAYWKDHREQLRQSETQRAVLTNYLLVITAALGGFVAQQKFALTTLPVSILVVGIGLYGAVAVAKYHERARYHLFQARALTRVLRDAGALAADDTGLQDARAAHERDFPRMAKVRLYRLWIGLHLGIVAFGLGLIVLTLAR
jgi:hypothetical protein